MDGGRTWFLFEQPESLNFGVRGNDSQGRRIMAAGNLILNPYEPIAIADAPSWRPVNPNAGIEVAVRKSVLRREFQLLGYVDATIVWDARATREWVTVDGYCVASKLSLLYVPRFDFLIPAGGSSLNASLEVRVAFLFFVRGVRLMIEDQEIYSEGCFA